MAPTQDELRAVARALEAVAPHERLDESCRLMFSADFGLAERKLSDLVVLDATNYSARVVPDPLPLTRLLSLFPFESGYGSVSGEGEIGDAVRALEETRARRWIQRAALPGVARHQVVAAKTAVVMAAGVTSAAYIAMSAARLRDQESGGRRRKVVFNVPAYCLPDAFARMHGLRPVAVRPRKPDCWMGTPGEIEEEIDADTLLCFLTYPNNPAQRAWGLDQVRELKHLLATCQERGVVVIADTIFQDLDWKDAPVPEIFALAEHPENLVKVFGPSKDRPFSSGYRVGYVMSDRRLLPWLERSKALTENTSPTVSQIWLAFDAVFRRALFRGRLEDSDCELLANRFLFGYRQVELSSTQIRERIENARLFEDYGRSLGEMRSEVRSIMQRVHACLAASDCFSPLPLPDYGNLVMFKVVPPYDLGDETRYFLEALVNTGVTSLTGRCFGMAREDGVWGRISAGYYPADSILAGLDRLQDFLLAKARATPYPTATAIA